MDPDVDPGADQVSAGTVSCYPVPKGAFISTRVNWAGLRSDPDAYRGLSCFRMTDPSSGSLSSRLAAVQPSVDTRYLTVKGGSGRGE